MATVGLLFAIASLVLEAIALPGLFKRSKAGWNFVFYAVLVSTVSYLLHLDVLSLVFTVVTFYFLFQIRSYYK